VLVGEESSFTDFLKSLVDTFTNAIINTFVEGFSDQLFGEGGLVFDFLKNIGSSMFAGGATVGESAQDIVSKTPGLDSTNTALIGSIAGQTNDLQVALAAQTTALEMALRAKLGPAAAAGYGNVDGNFGGLGTDSFSANLLGSGDIKTPQLVDSDFNTNLAAVTAAPNLVNADFTANLSGRNPDSVANGMSFGSGFEKPLSQLGALNTENSNALGATFSMGAGQIVLAVGGLATAFAAAKSGNTVGALLGLATTAVMVFGGSGGGAANPVASGIPTFATGGPVSGAGTGTSDSIPAWLSNGEYVINAKATKANRPLLDSINFGNAKKYATGGPVGGSTLMAFTPSAPTELEKAPAKSNQSIVVENNFNLTGDLSRQTKKEVLKLGGEISSIVYNNFRERRLIS